MDMTEALEQSQPGLVGRITDAIRKHQLTHRSEQTYLHWITRFVLFNDLKDPETLADADRREFLAYLSEQIRVSRARLNQASQALTFFYDDVLGNASLERAETAAA